MRELRKKVHFLSKLWISSVWQCYFDHFFVKIDKFSGDELLKKKSKTQAPVPAQLSAAQMSSCIPLSAVFFLVVCLLSASTIKKAAVGLIALTLALAFLWFFDLRERVTPPLLALGLYVLMNGVSMFYAVSGKFALYEFLKILCAFCLALILLAAAPGQNMEAGRWIASILEGFTALAALVSIDLISTHLIGGPFLDLLSVITPDYVDLSPLAPGMRMNSIFINPNVFAGIAGIGAMLSLGLTMSSKEKKERCVHTACLAVISLAFVLAFSMGGSGTIAVAFLVYLVLENKERRPRLFLLMVETLVVTLISAMAISATSFDEWTAPRPIPLVCAVLGAAVLCALETFVDPRLTEKLQGHSRMVMVLLSGAAVLIAVYAVLAFNLTGPAKLEPGGNLYRSIYPKPGEYTLDIQADGPVNVSVTSQSKMEVTLYRFRSIYQGPAEGASFTVPDDSIVVYLRLTSDQPVEIEQLSCLGAGETVKVPLRYKLLPGFMANRLQGLFANNSVKQRQVYIEDGFKLFWRSPLIGSGLGGFENGVKSVESYYYETKYLHNHFVQTLVDTGIIGLLLFVGLIAISGVSVWLAIRKQPSQPMLPALGGALAFMVGHGAAEVDFSIYSYLPIAFSVFALIGLCCQEALPRSQREKDVQTGAVLTTFVLLIAFGVLLNGNMRAAALVAQDPTIEDLAEAAEMDKFEWADYMLSYVVSSMDDNAGEEIRLRADRYAQRLSRVSSNTIPLYLANYYLSLGQTERGLEMAEKYTAYTASDSAAWQATFDLLEAYEEDTELFRSGVRRLAEQMDTWNSENLGHVQVSEESMAFLEKMRS